MINSLYKVGIEAFTAEQGQITSLTTSAIQKQEKLSVIFKI